MKSIIYLVLIVSAALGLLGCNDGPVFVYTEIETYTDSDRVRVRIDKLMSKEESETIMERLKEMTGAKERGVTRMTGPRESTWFDLAPITNIQALAAKIDFGNVESITGRVIVVSIPEK